MSKLRSMGQLISKHNKHSNIHSTNWYFMLSAQKNAHRNITTERRGQSSATCEGSFLLSARLTHYLLMSFGTILLEIGTWLTDDNTTDNKFSVTNRHHGTAAFIPGHSDANWDTNYSYSVQGIPTCAPSESRWHNSRKNIVKGTNEGGKERERRKGRERGGGGRGRGKGLRKDKGWARGCLIRYQCCEKWFLIARHGKLYQSLFYTDPNWKFCENDKREEISWQGGRTGDIYLSRHALHITTTMKDIITHVDRSICLHPNTPATLSWYNWGVHVSHTKTRMDVCFWSVKR